ncbi:MAG: hypothetical protein R3A44_38340 [Caldilineaceae bacterium]
MINLRGMKALQQLRIDIQESAEMEFPHACLTEMLLLYDVCKYLELSIFQAREVLGAPAYHMVMKHLNAPVSLPTKQAQALLQMAAQAQ